MPTYRDIDVHVTDAKGARLTEWRVRKRDRSRLSTCYIQSKTGMAFRTAIKPTVLPYPGFVGEVVYDDGQAEGEDEGKRERKPPKSKVNFNLLSFADDVYEVDKYGRSLGLRQRGSPELGSHTPTPLPQPKAPWHLLATLRLDGRRHYEKRSIVYLDRRHPKCHTFDCQTIIKARMVTDDEGDVRECGWVFKEVGIEDVFDKLFLSNGSGDEETEPATGDGDELLTAMNGLGANRMEDTDEKSTMGQIEVTLERIKLGETKHGIYRPDKLDDNDKLDISEADMTGVTHTAAYDAGKLRDKRIDTIYYDTLHEPDKKPYANFKFYYRNEGNPLQT